MDRGSEEFREAERQRLRAYRRGNRQVVERAIEWRRNHPTQVKVWTLVEQAVKKGALVRPEQCVCGRNARLHAHHDDYSRPLDVMWLCVMCHKARHRMLRQQAA